MEARAMRGTAVTVALVGLLLGLGGPRAAKAECCGCYCGSFDFSNLTACFDSRVDADQCPPCPMGEPLFGCDPDAPSTCSAKPEDAAVCARFSRSPAVPTLSPIPLAGLGMLLAGVAAWSLTRRRTRAAA